MYVDVFFFSFLLFLLNNRAIMGISSYSQDCNSKQYYCSSNYFFQIFSILFHLYWKFLLPISLLSRELKCKTSLIIVLIYMVFAKLFSLLISLRVGFFNFFLPLQNTFYNSSIISRSPSSIFKIYFPVLILMFQFAYAVWYWPPLVLRNSPAYSGLFPSCHQIDYNEEQGRWQDASLFQLSIDTNRSW